MCVKVEYIVYTVRTWHNIILVVYGYNCGTERNWAGLGLFAPLILHDAVVLCVYFVYFFFLNLSIIFNLKLQTNILKIGVDHSRRKILSQDIQTFRVQCTF